VSPHKLESKFAVFAPGCESWIVLEIILRGDDYGGFEGIKAITGAI
jgi:hypothetical protein